MTPAPAPVRVDDSTTLIDAGLYGVAGTSAVYLVRAGRTCLVDTGAGTETARVIGALRALDAFPPDVVVLTHAHYDHSQGVPGIRRAAGREVEVLAGRESLPLLEDQSWNRIFRQARALRDVPDVRPLDGGDVIDLDGVELEVVDTPGHITGNIALLDGAHGTLFAGDALGDMFGDRAYAPPMVPPHWDRDAFDATVERLASLEFGTLCITHFGVLRGRAARDMLEGARGACDAWSALFQEAEEGGWLDDTGRVASAIVEAMDIRVPDLRVERGSLRAMLGLLNLGRRVAGRPPLAPAELLFGALVEMLVLGWRTYRRG